MALESIARTLGARYSDYYGGWMTETCLGRNTLRSYGFQFSLNTSVASQIANDKAATADLLRRSSIPCVDSQLVLEPVRQAWISSTPSNEVLFNALIRATYPVVLKPNDGTSGVDVDVFFDLDTAYKAGLELLRRHSGILVQPKLDIIHEDRYLILADVCHLSYRKTANLDTNALPMFNLCLGAKVSAVELFPPDSAAMRMALRAANIVGLSVCAVDVVTIRGGDTMVLELNSGICFENFAGLGSFHRDAACAFYRSICQQALIA